MAAEVTAATQLLIVCNPNNPTATHHPGGRDRRLLRADPAARDRDPRRGLRRVPDRRRPRRHASTCWTTSRTWSSSAPSASATAWPGCGSATRSAPPNFRAAVDAVRQPFSVNALAQAAGAEAILHQDDVLEPGREHRRRAPAGGGGAARARPATAASPRPTSPGSTSATPTRPRSSPASPSGEIAVRAGDAARRPRPHPRQLRHRRPRTTAFSRRPVGNPRLIAECVVQSGAR